MLAFFYSQGSYLVQFDNSPFQLTPGINLIFLSAELAHDSLGFAWVIPEIRTGRICFYPSNFSLFARNVKDAPLCLKFDAVRPQDFLFLLAFVSPLTLMERLRLIV